MINDGHCKYLYRPFRLNNSLIYGVYFKSGIAICNILSSLLPFFNALNLTIKFLEENIYIKDTKIIWKFSIAQNETIKKTSVTQNVRSSSNYMEEDILNTLLK